MVLQGPEEVSTLLEILHPVNVVFESVDLLEMFQPFLRFYGVRYTVRVEERDGKFQPFLRFYGLEAVRRRRHSLYRCFNPS